MAEWMAGWMAGRVGRGGGGDGPGGDGGDGAGRPAADGGHGGGDADAGQPADVQPARGTVLQPVRERVPAQEPGQHRGAGAGAPARTPPPRHPRPPPLSFAAPGFGFAAAWWAGQGEPPTPCRRLRNIGPRPTSTAPPEDEVTGTDRSPPGS